MPEPDYAWLPKDTLLTFEEIGTIADAFCDLGVDRVRLTGGEPLLRRDLTSLVESLAGTPGYPRSRAHDQRRPAGRAGGRAARRRAAPDHRQPRHARSPALPRHDALRQPRRRARGHRRRRGAPASSRSRSTRSSCAASTIMSWPRSSSTAARVGAEVRFIEYMDVGGATRWSPGAVVSRREMLDILEQRFGTITPIDEESSAPADRFALPDGTVFGIISSTTEPFCQHMRPQPADRGRRLADVPLRERRNGPASPTARRRDRTTSSATSSRRSGPRARIAAQKSASASISAKCSSP